MLRRKGDQFNRLRRKTKDEELEGAIEDERSRRKLLGRLEGRSMGIYEGDPVWDDVVPIPQDEGEGALAAIAYSDEYAEGKSQLLLTYNSLSLSFLHSNIIPPRRNGLRRTLSKSPRPHLTHHLPQPSTLHRLALPGLHTLRSQLLNSRRTRMGQ